MKIIFAVVIFSLCSLSAVAQKTVQKTIMDGNTLDDMCRFVEKAQRGEQLSEEEGGKAAICAGYVRGILDDIWLQQTTPELLGLTAPGPLNICISDSISNNQAIKVVIKYLHDNPAKLQLAAGYLIRQALAASFPCADSAVSDAKPPVTGKPTDEKKQESLQKAMDDLEDCRTSSQTKYEAKMNAVGTMALAPMTRVAASNKLKQNLDAELRQCRSQYESSLKAINAK